MIDISSFAHLGDAALVVDEDRRCLQVNALVPTLLGLSPDSIVGRALEELSTPPRGLDIDDVWKTFLQLGAYEGAFPLVRQNGSRRAIQFRARANVEDRAHLIVLRDVTTQSEPETTATDRRERVEVERAELHAIVTDLPVAIVIFAAADFRIELANDAYFSLVGRDDVVGLTLDQIVPDVSPHSIYAYLADVVRSGQRRERKEHALLYPSKDGETVRYFTNTFQPLFDAAGAVRRVLVTVLDVTNDVRSRMLVAESAERLRVILDQLPVGANVRNAVTGELIINNKASTDILGLELMGHSDSGSLAALQARFPDGRLLEADDHAFRRAMITRQPVRNQIVLVERSGTSDNVVVRSSAAIVESPDGVALVVSVVEDITDEYRLLAEHEETARYAETCVGILAHDLRTPLGAIAMGASLLETRLHETQDAKIVSRITSSARRMGEMVTQLLDLTRSRLAGGIPIERSRVDLVTILSGVLDEIALANPHVTLSRTLPRQLLGDWDGGRMAQVISNLVGNAVQHGDLSRPIDVTLEDRALTARLTVRSYGPVIPGDILPDVFDPFRQRAEAPRGKTTGLGLGLYITREIVEAHGGTIRASSTEADGTRFAVDVPRVPPGP